MKVLFEFRKLIFTSMICSLAIPSAVIFAGTMIKLTRINLMSYQQAQKIFGVHCAFSLDELVSRYRSLARQHHPDVGGSTSEMQKINEAYGILKNSLSSQKSNVGNANQDFYGQQNNTYNYSNNCSKSNDPLWSKFYKNCFLGATIVACVMHSDSVLNYIVSTLNYAFFKIQHPQGSRFIVSGVSSTGTDFFDYLKVKRQPDDQIVWDKIKHDSNNTIDQSTHVVAHKKRLFLYHNFKSYQTDRFVVDVVPK